MLGVTLETVRNMSLTEFHLWLAHIKQKNKGRAGKGKGRGGGTMGRQERRQLE